MYKSCLSASFALRSAPVFPEMQSHTSGFFLSEFPLQVMPLYRFSYNSLLNSCLSARFMINWIYPFLDSKGGFYIAYNKKFVEEKRYEQYAASKYPNKKVAILTCMDTRLVELLPAALGIKNGDVKMIKNAGGVVTNPFGSVIRSLLVGIIELGVTEVLVIGHTDCGVQHIDSEMMIHHMKNRGISQESIDLMKFCGIDFEKWLAGFDTVEDSVRETVDTIRNHPLIPKDVRISGFVINTETGELMPIC